MTHPKVIRPKTRRWEVCTIFTKAPRRAGLGLKKTEQKSWLTHKEKTYKSNRSSAMSSSCWSKPGGANPCGKDRKVLGSKTRLSNTRPYRFVRGMTLRRLLTGSRVKSGGWSLLRFFVLPRDRRSLPVRFAASRGNSAVSNHEHST